jgi:predicted 2-oxoglutarate/Fe(II)-dependent dioxygenase YbiX
MLIAIETMRGERCCSISMSPFSSCRGMPAHPSIVQLTGVYHNLLRQWAEM